MLEIKQKTYKNDLKSKISAKIKVGMLNGIKLLRIPSYINTLLCMKT